MSAWSAAVVSAGPPPRGSGTQDPATVVAQSMNSTFSWGSAPGQATLVYAGGPTGVAQGALLEIVIGGFYFVGRCVSDRGVKASSGYTRTLEFVDLRDFLTWDWVFAAFNKADVRIEGGVRVKRYRHLYPADYNDWRWTYTNEPLPGHRILAALFGASTVGSPWVWDLTSNGEFPDGLMNEPVYEVDFLGGCRLDSALTQLSQALGVVFTHQPTQARPYRLVWTRKGYGTIEFPADSDQQQTGAALAGNPTNVRVLGDRNLYQFHDVEMQPAWARGWDAFLTFDDFADDIYRRGYYRGTQDRFINTPNDAEGIYGRQAAYARACEIAVWEYVELRNAVRLSGEATAGDGARFEDWRKYHGRSRADMPAALYLEQIVRHAFVPVLPAALADWAIADKLLCTVSHNPATGEMTWYPDEPAEGNGYAIVRGYNVGADLFRTVRSDQFNLDNFTVAKSVWEHVELQWDDSGDGQRYALFGEPIFDASTLAVGKDGHVVFDRSAVIGIPSVRCAVCLEGEPYSYWQRANGMPVTGRDTVENVRRLHGEYVVTIAGDGTWSYAEIPYSDGKSADTKAAEIADGVLQRQYSYAHGGYRWIWNPATTAQKDFVVLLRSLIDRIQVQLSPTSGLVALVEFTRERLRDHFEEERELDRRTVQNTLFPGQAELRAQAEVHRKLAAGLRASPQLRRSLTELLRSPLGLDVPTQETRFVMPTGMDLSAVVLPAGSPIWKKPAVTASGQMGSNTVATYTPLVDTADSIFCGVTIAENVPAHKPFRTQALGIGLARVKGPVNAGESVGKSVTTLNADWLEKNGAPGVGVAKQSIAGTDVCLIQVDFNSGGGGGTSLPVWL